MEKRGSRRASWCLSFVCAASRASGAAFDSLSPPLGPCFAHHHAFLPLSPTLAKSFPTGGSRGDVTSSPLPSPSSLLLSASMINNTVRDFCDGRERKEDRIERFLLTRRYEMTREQQKTRPAKTKKRRLAGGRRREYLSSFTFMREKKSQRKVILVRLLFDNRPASE